MNEKLRNQKSHFNRRNDLETSVRSIQMIVEINLQVLGKASAAFSRKTGRHFRCVITLPKTFILHCHHLRRSKRNGCIWQLLFQGQFKLFEIFTASQFVAISRVRKHCGKIPTGSETDPNDLEEKGKVGN